MALRSSLFVSAFALLAHGLVEVPIERVSVAQHSPGLERRQPSLINEPIVGTILDHNPDSVRAYAINISVGTPPQMQTVMLDTRQSQSFLISSTSEDCTTMLADTFCPQHVFRANLSSSLNTIKKRGFQASVTEGGNSKTYRGDAVTDVMEFGNTTIGNVSFGLAEQVPGGVHIAHGVLGLGYSASQSGSTQSPSIVDVLKQSGAINSRLFSIYFKNEAEVSGSIIFGGVDTSRFTGQLVSLNLKGKSKYETINKFIIHATDLKAWNNGKKDDVLRLHNINYLVDTASPYWEVPSKIFHKMMKRSKFSDDQSYLPCSYRDKDIRFEVKLNDRIWINVPLRDLLVPAPAKHGKSERGEKQCELLLKPCGDEKGLFSLGQPVLKNAYVVFDMDNGQLSVGKAAHSTSSSESQKPVMAGPNGLRDAVGGRLDDTPHPQPSPIASPVSPSSSAFIKTTTSPAGESVSHADAEPTAGSVSDSSTFRSASKKSRITVTVTDGASMAATALSSTGDLY